MKKRSTFTIATSMLSGSLALSGRMWAAGAPATQKVFHKVGNSPFLTEMRTFARAAFSVIVTQAQVPLGATFSARFCGALSTGELPHQGKMNLVLFLVLIFFRRIPIILYAFLGASFFSRPEAAPLYADPVFS